MGDSHSQMRMQVVLLLLLPLLSLVLSGRYNRKPNIIFILLDDVGWTDLSYNVNGKGDIHTPKIDHWANQGIKLKCNYVQPSCTPTRASLMTGRYAANTGLPYAKFPGSVVGIPPDQPTMPELLRQAGYNAHMIGKWHLGYAKWAQSPVGRGFESHVGSFMWDHDSFTKRLIDDPFTPKVIDWGKYYKNRSYVHEAESQHSTIVQTREAVLRMKEHKEANTGKPLFLYLAYNAPHSPLQSEKNWRRNCKHIPHTLRRQFCAMMKGVDIGVNLVIRKALSFLGKNTVVVLSSDNGGGPWYGGMNEPLRSGKLNSFEGGVRVPGFVLDLSGNFIPPRAKGTEFKHMLHVSDWLPTFLSWAGASELGKNIGLDGISQAKALASNKAVRTEVLLELLNGKQTHDGTHSKAYRDGKYKLIWGNIRDPHWYKISTEDSISTSDTSFGPIMLEKFMTLMEKTFGNGPMDIIRLNLFNRVLFEHYKWEQKKRIPNNEDQIVLFDLEADPEERHDLANEKPDIVEALKKKLLDLTKKAPRIQPYWKMMKNYTEGFVSGHCPGIKEKYCKFTHPWLPEHVDLNDVDALGLGGEDGGDDKDENGKKEKWAKIDKYKKFLEAGFKTSANIGKCAMIPRNAEPDDRSDMLFYLG